MEIRFYLKDNENGTPIKVADALIECGRFEAADLEEIAAHLNVYCNRESVRKMHEVYDAHCWNESEG